MKLSTKPVTKIVMIGILATFILAACRSATTTGEEPAANNEPAEQIENETETAVPEPEEPTEVPPTETPLPEPTEEEEMEEGETDAEESEMAEEDQLILDDGTIVFTTDDRSNGLKSLTSAWNTNWDLRTIATDEILSGGPPRDGIPSIDDPKFISQDEATEWLVGNEPVVAIEFNGDARAYPIQILTWHEIVNDTAGDIPIIVTFCPLCNSAIVFERTVDGEAVEFGTSGLLRNSDLIMYDRKTESLWQQFTGEAIIGDAVGTTLTFLPSSLISFDDFRAAYPEGRVLSRDTGMPRNYGRNPYGGYDEIGNNPFLFQGDLDERLAAVERVVTVSLEDDIDIAYPLTILSEMGTINDTQGDVELAVFHLPGTSSALGATIIADAEDVGATGVFNRVVDGQTLTFTREGENFVDAETGTTWNIVGHAIDGELVGTQLEPIIHGDHFWFSWAAFKPDTIIYQG